MKKSILYILVVVILSACGDTEATRQRLDRQQRLEQQRQDSLALKIAVLPTLDCVDTMLRWIVIQPFVAQRSRA